MAGVKPLDRVTEKWKRVSGGAQAEYEEGVKNPSKDWATETAKAENAYTQGVQKAISDKRFGRGVRKAGSSKWQTGAMSKGPGRWAEGIGLAEDAYAAGFGPYHAELGRIDYPEKKARGDPANIKRVAVVAEKLHALKLRLKGGS